MILNASLNGSGSAIVTAPEGTPALSQQLRQRIRQGGPIRQPAVRVQQGGLQDRLNAVNARPVGLHAHQRDLKQDPAHPPRLQLQD